MVRRGEIRLHKKTEKIQEQLKKVAKESEGGEVCLKREKVRWVEDRGQRGALSGEERKWPVERMGCTR